MDTKNLKSRILSSTLCGIAAFGLAQGTHAAPNLIQNPGFTASSSGTSGELNFNTTLTDWNSVSLPGQTAENLSFIPGTDADSVGALTSFGSHTIMYGPGNTTPVANGFTVSPYGPDMAALGSGDGIQGALQQTVGGLTVGQTYMLTFYWAGAQQVGYTGATTDQLGVSFGSTSNTTPVINVASTGFTGWETGQMSFTATSTSELLSFLAIGTPSATDPPFVLLDGVSLTQTTGAPDTASTAGLFGITAAALAYAASRRSRKCQS